ncbi:hypothetical protein H5410_059717 [Solanum commersonii]|uniref:Uncharacterized protein n=1 Tax=Solanum commersonii TaxID=4109 RepID=A0A9J5W3I3_SOLCO|nr:hypothetical protein H5410_059717 [Solanum commersonii]
MMELMENSLPENVVPDLILLPPYAFPQNLKNLAFSGTTLQWKDLSILNIQYWRASCDHFPCLERLFLERCFAFDSIPQDFADITTLALIDIRRCSKSVENSTKQIQQDIKDKYASFVEVHIL